MKVTKQQIEQWKKQYGDVFRIRVEDKEGYLRKPDRKTLSYASSVAANDPLKFNEIILKNCWLGGDKALIDDDAYFLAVSAKMDELIQIKEATLEKL
jgi:acyl-coenzyme A synthetase/AMP-(fatty) acid ligase